MICTCHLHPIDDLLEGWPDLECPLESGECACGDECAGGSEVVT